MIFVSGDPHWAEFMAKRMPASEVWGPEQTLYEVTASGIPQNLPGFYLNSNRSQVSKLRLGGKVKVSFRS